MESITEKQIAYFDKILALVKTFRPDVYEAIKSQVSKEDCINIAKNIRYVEKNRRIKDCGYHIF